LLLLVRSQRVWYIDVYYFLFLLFYLYVCILYFILFIIFFIWSVRVAVGQTERGWLPVFAAFETSTWLWQTDPCRLRCDCCNRRGTVGVGHIIIIIIIIRSKIMLLLMPHQSKAGKLLLLLLFIGTFYILIRVPISVYIVFYRRISK